MNGSRFMFLGFGGLILKGKSGLEKSRKRLGVLRRLTILRGLRTMTFPDVVLFLCAAFAGQLHYASKLRFMKAHVFTGFGGQARQHTGGSVSE